jgi:membrane protease YdiL (CAAX protease family)
VTPRRQLVLFFALAYGISWLVFVPMVVFRAPLQWTVLATFGPTIAALLTHRVTTRSFGAFRIVSSWPRMIGATALGVALIIFAFVVLPGVVTADPRKLNWSVLASLSVYSYSTLLGGPLGEEPGWRGYALPRLEAALGPVLGSALLGCLWAGWHLPLFFYPGWTSSPPWIYLLIQIGSSIILGFATNLGGFSVIPAIAMHAAFNTLPRFLPVLFAETGPHTSLPFELVLALCGLAVAAGLVVATRGRLGLRVPSA